MGRALRSSERSDFYGTLLEPPRATPAIMAAATAKAAETAAERADRIARKKTTPAPKGRRPGPRGRMFHVSDDGDDSAQNTQ